MQATCFQRSHGSADRARDEKRGAEAVKNLAVQGLFNVLFHPLEAGDLSRAARLAEFIREQYGKLDILVLPLFLFQHHEYM